MSFKEFIHNSKFTVRVNRITVSDDARAFPHNHGCDFISIGLRGWYAEDVYEAANVEKGSKRHLRAMFNVHRMNNTQLHKIAAVSEKPAYTLFVTFNYAHKPPLAYGPNGEVETMGEMYRRLGYGKPNA
jgi:predicted metal-dependent enzyme (double-stranded beta helix superfamily)